MYFGMESGRYKVTLVSFKIQGKCTNPRRDGTANDGSATRVNKHEFQLSEYWTAFASCLTVYHLLIMSCVFLPEVVDPIDGRKQPHEPNSVLLLRGKLD
jgi:hypothetical protein